MQFDFRSPRLTRMYPQYFPAARRAELVDFVQSRVLDWLRGSDALPTLHLSVIIDDANPNDDVMLFFDRSEMYLKATLGEWEIWRVATATNWHTIISHRVGWVNTFLHDDHNDLSWSLVLPNEVRIQEFDEDSDKNWNLFGKAHECPQQLSLPTMPTV